MPHAKAVDTVPKWRAEREARLEERRRREQCQTPALRASVVSRVMAPMRAGAGSDSSSFDGGDSSDGLEVRDSVEDGEITEGRLERCDFERTVARMGGVALEMDCFRMAELTRELTLPTQTGSRRRAREFDVAALL